MNNLILKQACSGQNRINVFFAGQNNVAERKTLVRAFLQGLMLCCLALLTLPALVTPASATTLTRSSAFVYDPTTGLLLEEIIEPGSSQYCLATVYTYDAFGNKASVTTRNCNGTGPEAAAPSTGSAALITSRTTTTSYTSSTDSTGRFPLQVTNALSQTETHLYDPRFGGVTSLTGPNGLTTTWAYDPFGRKQTETRADTSTTTWNYYAITDTTHCISAPTTGTASYAYCMTVQDSSNTDATYTYYDTLNRRIASSHRDFALTNWVDTDLVVYDAYGRVTQSYLPYDRGGSTSLQYTTTTYDALGRTLTQTAPNGLVSSNTYAGFQTTVTVSGSNIPGSSQSTTTLQNSQGTVSVTDTQSNVISYARDPFGDLLQTTDAAGNVITFGYDTRGRKTSMTDPDMGTWTYTYDALGELVSQTDAKSQTSTMTYDVLGRMLTRSEADLNSTWVYDTATHGIGKIASVSSDNGYSRTYSYDTLGRSSSVSTVIDSTIIPYVTTTTYDGYSRVLTRSVPGVPDPTSAVGTTISTSSTFTFQNVYNGDGYLTQVANAASPYTVYWTANAMDASGNLTQQTYGNGVITNQTFDPATNRLSTQQAGVGGGTAIQYMSYSYDMLGNVLARNDSNAGLSEAYTYDTLNRVATAAASSGTVINSNSYFYNAIGNITCKSDISTCSGTTSNYTYNTSGASSVRPHATAGITGTINGVTNPTYAYDANGNMTGGAGRTVSWWSYNMVNTITNTTTGASTSFIYNPDHERTREYLTDGSEIVVLSPRYDTGLHFEKKYLAASGTLTGAIEYENYLYAGGLMFGKIITTTATDGVTVASTVTEYYNKDHLGSIVDITDGSGTLVQNLSYDVWGKRRNLDGSADTSNALASADMYHGYTGHEMMDEVGLVNMNGRVYDPVMGRFVSADFMIEAPGNLQSYNRYTYVMNNPLALTDPSGQCWGPTCWIPDPFAHLNSVLASAWHSTWNNPIFQGVVQIVLTYACNGSPTCDAAYEAAYTKYEGGTWTDAAKAAAISYGTAEAFQYVGNITNGHLQPGVDYSGANYYENIIGHALVGCVSAEASGGGCRSGALSAGFGAAASPWIYQNLQGTDAMVAVSVIGGTASVLGGGRFANGAVTAAFGYWYNARGCPNCKGELPDNQRNAGQFILGGAALTVAGIGAVTYYGAEVATDIVVQLIDAVFGDDAALGSQSALAGIKQESTQAAVQQVSKASALPKPPIATQTR